jgi:type IV secretion system protein TrbL
MNAAMFLFWTLGTISLVFTFGFMALRKADIGEFFAEFIRFILFFGFFLWLLR